MNHSARGYDFLWASLAILPLVTLSFLFAIHAQDYWWYLRVGQDTLLQGAIPVTDTVSWSRAGEPVFYQTWLAGVIFWLVHDFGGAPLTYLLRGVLLGVTFGVLWFLARQASGPRTATLLVLIMGASSTNNWQMRPQLFAYPLFALCLYSLYQWQEGKNRALWILPISTALWANLHGSFILPLVVAGAALVFGRGNRKALFIALLFIVLGTFLNPRGVFIWPYLDFMMNTPTHHLYSVEWFPPTNSGWQLNIFYAWILLLAPLAALSPRKPNLMEWVLFLGFGWLAFSGIRYVIWFLFILSVMTAAPLDGLMRGKLDSSVPYVSPLFNYALSGCILLLSLFYLPGIRERWWSEAPPVYAAETNPIDAVEWLKDHPELPGPLWNDFAFGSYLAFALPSQPTWLDSRFFVFPPEQMMDYQKISHGSPEWESLLQRQGVNLLLLSAGGQAPLIEQLKSSPDWCGHYRDPYAVIYARCDPIP